MNRKKKRSLYSKEGSEPIPELAVSSQLSQSSYPSESFLKTCEPVQNSLPFPSESCNEESEQSQEPLRAVQDTFVHTDHIYYLRSRKCTGDSDTTVEKSDSDCDRTFDNDSD